MYKLTVNNQILELSLSLFYHYINNTIVSLFETTAVLFSMQVMGYPDSIREAVIPYIMKDILVLEESATQIDDEELRDDLKKLIKGYKVLLNIDKAMANRISTLTGLTIDDLRSSSKYGQFQRDPQPSDATHPEWYANGIFQQLLNKAEKLMVTILENIEKIIQNLMWSIESSNSASDIEITKNSLKKIAALREFLNIGSTN